LDWGGGEVGWVKFSERGWRKSSRERKNLTLDFHRKRAKEYIILLLIYFIK